MTLQFGSNNGLKGIYKKINEVSKQEADNNLKSSLGHPYEVATSDSF